MSKRNTAVVTSSTIVIGIAIFCAIYALVALLLMVLWGAVAGSFHWQTISFGQSILITLLLALVASFFKRGK